MALISLTRQPSLQYLKYSPFLDKTHIIVRRIDKGKTGPTLQCFCFYHSLPLSHAYWYYLVLSPGYNVDTHILHYMQYYLDFPPLEKSGVFLYFYEK